MQLAMSARTGTRGPQGVGHEDFTGSADVVRAGSGFVRPAADARDTETVNERHAEASGGRCAEVVDAGLQVGLGRQRLRDEDGSGEYGGSRARQGGDREGEA